MAIFWVTSTALNDRQKHMAYPLLVKFGNALDLEPATENEMEEMVERLTRNGIVRGWRLDSEHGTNNTRVITRRLPYAITLRGIAAIAPAEYLYTDPATKT